MFCRLSLLTLMVAVFSTLALPVYAQQAAGSGVPIDFDTQTTNSDAAVVSQPEDLHLYDDLKNPWFRDVLALNHQNQLLGRVVSRQQSISKIEESFGKMGIAYNAPPPSYDICAQLPMNAACGRAYPDLYGGYVAKRQEEIRKQMEEYAKKAELRRAISGVGNADASTISVTQDLPPMYYWQDVKCLNGQCRAVLVGINNTSDTKTVRVGDALNEKTKVKSINEMGVILSFKGKSVELQPKPLDAKDAPATNNNAISNLVDSVANQTAPKQPAPAAETDTTAAASTPSAGAPTPQANSAGRASSQPALGPTGLF